MQPAYRRILLKLSGEALAGEKDTGFCIDEQVLMPLCRSIARMVEMGVEVAVVCGGGNIWRGRAVPEMERTRADQAGMLATVINALALQDGLIRSGVKAAFRIDLVISTVLGAVLLVFGRPLTMLFLDQPDPVILDTAARFLLITAVPGILCGIMQIFQQTLRGAGFANQAVVGGFIQLAAKVAVAAVGAWGLHSLDVVWLAWPISFVAGTVYPWLVYRKAFAATEAEE